MNEKFPEERFDAQCDEVPPHHYIRSHTLESMRKRLAILRDERGHWEIAPDDDLDGTTAAYLATLRNSLQKCRTENTRLAMLALLKTLEKELVQRGIDPEAEIKWVLEQLAHESASLSSFV